MIPRFSFNNEVTPDTARHDKITLKMDMGTVAGGMEQIDALRHDLGNPSNDAQGLRNYLFCQPQQHGPSRPALNLRRRRITRPGIAFPPPLFAGKLAFGPYVGAGVSASRVSLYLSVSPVRLARFQPVPRDSESNEFIFAGDAPPECPQGEYSLDNKDNWILAGAQDDWHTPARWIAHLAECFLSIRGVVFDEILNASTAAAVALSQDQSSLLQSCETHWEFQSDNPTAHVREMLPLLNGFGTNAAATDYLPPQSVRQRIAGNCLSLSLEVRAGVFLRIYAKTNRRIRFEVEHILKRNAAPVERPAADGIGTTRALTAGNDAQLVDLLLMLRGDAAQIVNRALAHMRTKSSVEPSHINETMLLLQIGCIVKNYSLAVTIAETLRTHGGFDANGVTGKMRNAIERLQNKVLRFNPQTVRYEPTGDYAHALRRLQDRQDSLLTARQRALPVSPDVGPSASANPAETATAAQNPQPPPARVRTLPPDMPPPARVRTLPPDNP